VRASVTARRFFRAALVIATLAVSQWAAALPANVEAVEGFRGVTQYRLKSNGMTLLAVQDRSRPVVTFMVVYHVGSRNEAPGNTGSAHLLEHMLFNKSTENFGRAKGHPTVQELLYEAGADFRTTNMTTWYDRMNGYSTLPPDKLGLAMRIEADRLGRALILDSERQSEMSVVRNEYEIGENDPEQALYKAVVAASIQAHPYHWSTIGYRSDIEGVTTEKLREHYKAFFWPDNADAILVGDFDLDHALALFDREFGAFPRASHPIPKVITVEPPQEGERRVVVHRPGTLDLVMLAYPRPGAMHPDFMPLEVLSNILTGGVNSRLHQALVETKIATRVGSDNYTLRDPFPLLITATLVPGRTHDEAEKALKAALAKIAAEGVTPEELARAQQQIEVSVIRSRDGTYNYASNLGEAVASADWKWFLTYVDRIKAVTADDVKRVASTYLVPEHATVGWFVPSKPGAAAALPVVAARAAAAPTGQRSPEAEARAQLPAFAAARSAASTVPKPFAERTHRTVLPNGIVLDVVENHSVPTVAIRGLVRAGDALAPEGEPALPGLVANMLARGTRTHSKEKIAAMLDDVGASRSYGCGFASVDVAADGMARDLPLLVSVLAEEMSQPAFGDAELDKARQELENDYARADDSTYARSLERLRRAVFPPGHPYYAYSRAEKVKSAGAIGVEDLRRFHAARYTGANVILAIVGDVDAARVEKLVKEAFGALPRGEREGVPDLPVTRPDTPPIRTAVTMHGKASANIMLGTASGLRRRDADYEAALVANAVLGETALSSRLGKRVRDIEGLSYSLGSRLGFADDLDGVWYASINVAPQNMERALASAREVIAQYVREGPTPAEIEVQKSFFAGNFQVGLGTNAGIASALASAEKFGFGPRYLDEYPARIRAVTPRQVEAALKKHVAAGPLNVIVSGDLEILPPARD